MVRKRAVREVDLCSSVGSETGGSEDVQCSQLPYMDYDSFEYFSDSQADGDVSIFVFFSSISFIIFKKKLFGSNFFRMIPRVIT
jgi:hypothetical protein